MHRASGSRSCAESPGNIREDIGAHVDRRQVHPFVIPVEVAACRTVDHGRDRAPAQQRGIHPACFPANEWPSTGCLRSDRPDQLDDFMIGLNRKWLTIEGQVDLGLEARIGLAAPFGDAFQPRNEIPAVSPWIVRLSRPGEGGGRTRHFTAAADRPEACTETRSDTDHTGFLQCVWRFQDL